MESGNGQDRTTNYLRGVLLIVGLVAIIWIIWNFILYGYNFYDTGFNSYVLSKNSSIEIVPKKFLWDWLNLLIIPIVLVVLGYFLNQTEEKRKREISHKEAETERDIAKRNNLSEKRRFFDRQREESLQNYFDKMASLLLDYNLKDAQDQTRSNLARTKTLTVLRVLDGARKGLVLKFLFDAGLISGIKPIISLEYADFSRTEFLDAYLGDVNLQKADFSKAKLFQVEFNGANLIGTNFQEAKLINGKFVRSSFNATKMAGADLTGASFADSLLKDVHFQNTDLSGSEWINCENKNCIFEVVKLTGSKIDRSKFINNKFNDVDLQKATFHRVNLRNAKFNAVRFFGSDLYLSNFSSTDLYDVGFENTQLAGVNFSKSKLNKVNFINSRATFTKTHGNKKSLPDAVFTQAEALFEVRILENTFSQAQLNQIINTKKGLMRSLPSSRNLITELLNRLVSITLSIFKTNG